MKGFQRLIPVMRQLPDVDLRIAGAGPFEPELRALARELPNVSFEGLLGAEALGSLFRGARAVIVPSLFPETFGYVVLEAFAMRTPVIVHRGGGALAETGVDSGGGLGYETDAELLAAIRRLVEDDRLREELAEAGYAVRQGEWSESAHIESYLGLIERCRLGKVAATPHERPVRQAVRDAGAIGPRR
jgi:glycosyltransferase involved in cell wall biosynthesis